MPLAPMANLFAVGAREPRALEAIETDLLSSHSFETVFKPNPLWVIGWAPLPESGPEPEQVRAAGLVFVHGRDRACHGARGIERLLALVDHRPQDLNQLPGDFAFVRFRPDGTVAAVRACNGLAPLYVRRSAGSIAIGTLLRYFTDFLPGPHHPDPLMTASWGRFPQMIDGRTFLQGVSILPRGTCAELEPDRVSASVSYWHPWEQQPRKREEHGAELRELLIEGLRRDLDPAGRNLITLSGGTDSGALAHLARRTLGSRLISLSLVPSGGPDLARELSYLEPLVAELEIDVALRHTLDADRYVRDLDRMPGLPFLVIHPALCQLSQIASQNEVRVLVGGEFGDEIGGDPGRMVDWALHSSLRALITEPTPLGWPRRSAARAWLSARIRRRIGRPLLLAEPELPPWARAELIDEYAEWRSRQQGERRTMGIALSQLFDRLQGDAWVPMNWEAASPLGIRRSIPFFSREVLELAFRCHPSELVSGRRKRLLAAALCGLVPDRVLDRPGKDSWALHLGQVSVDLPDSLNPLARSAVREAWFSDPPAGLPFTEGASLVRLDRLARTLSVDRP